MKTLKSKPVIHWGFIGCGDVTEVKSGPAYQQVDGFKVVAVAARNPNKVVDYARRHSIPKYYTDATQLIHDAEIDAVYIATPPDSHKQYALEVAEAGKVCCIEKPMAPSYAEAKVICDIFMEKQLPLFVAYYRRSLPRFEQVRQWLVQKAIGDVRHISWTLCRPPSERDKRQEYHWRTDKQVAKAGYFDDLASHGIDLFAHWLGPITQANGISVNQQGYYSSEDSITGSWLHESGVTGSGSWNFGSYYRQDKVEILGSKGRLLLSVFDEAPIKLLNQEREESLFIENPKPIQRYHVENMEKHLRGKSTHPSLGESAAQASWVMDSISD